MKPQRTTWEPQQTKKIKEHREAGWKSWGEKGRGGQYHSNSNTNNACNFPSGISTTSGYSDRGGYTPNRVNNNSRGTSSRGKGNFPSSKGVTQQYCLKLNHYAKDCRERISKGNTTPVVDIEVGL
jgi:hypothetical protein